MNTGTDQTSPLYVACAYLFSPEEARKKGFLSSLDLIKLENAYQIKKRRYDPDFHPHESREMRENRAKRLVKIEESYDLLKKHVVHQKKEKRQRAQGRKRIIAVGGAKGGTGKSIVAANLGVYLARQGLKTILMDLDLGGTNLHLYLGQRSLEHTLADYLDKTLENLEDTLVPTEYGPYLIGGGGSKLGAANIHFARKLKLIRAIKKIDADCIIFDLGGDTSFNIIDFFILAGEKYVVTTCEPAAYLGAYNLIKLGLYRKLNRLFGPETDDWKFRDRDLERFIQERLESRNGEADHVIPDIITGVSSMKPNLARLVNRVLTEYQPQLIVNQVKEHESDVEVAGRIQEVAQRMLSIHVGHLCSIPYEPDIAASTHQLVPAIVLNPQSALAESFIPMK